MPSITAATPMVEEEEHGRETPLHVLAMICSIKFSSNELLVQRERYAQRESHSLSLYQQLIA
jgi:hypothetical protein